MFFPLYYLDIYNLLFRSPHPSSSFLKIIKKIINQNTLKYYYHCQLINSVIHHFSDKIFQKIMGTNGFSTEEKKNSTMDTTEKQIIVTTKNGKLRGKQIRVDNGKTVNAFLGIPYARAPVGELRFKKPVPPVPWSGIREATKQPPMCPQRPFLRWFDSRKMSEDCLCLNVLVPSSKLADPIQQQAQLPVLVFVHGGAFVGGSAAIYSGKGICKNFVVPHQILYIAVQYRLGPLGFFSTGDQCCDDNLGLWDLTMALRWIQSNISAFGGDKNNVTLMGESAGGVLVDLLAMSPHSRDLFHKVIPMSGCGNNEWTLHDNAVDRCREFAQKLGIFANNSEELISQMRSVRHSKFCMDFVSDHPPLGQFQCPLAPRADRQFLPKSLAELRRETTPKPTLIGVCKLEGLFFMMLERGGYSLSQLQRIIAQRFPENEFPDTFGQLRREVLEMYTKGADLGTFSKDQKRILMAVAELTSDLFTGIACQRHVDEQLALGNPSCWLYSFDYCNPRQVRLLAYIFRQKLPFVDCMHGCELNYLFGVFDNRWLVNDRDRALTREMAQLWANFARYGNPNGPNPDKCLWHPISEKKPSQCLSIKPGSQMVDFQGGRPFRWVKLLGGKSK